MYPSLLTVLSRLLVCSSSFSLRLLCCVEPTRVVLFREVQTSLFTFNFADSASATLDTSTADAPDADGGGGGFSFGFEVEDAAPKVTRAPAVHAFPSMATAAPPKRDWMELLGSVSNGTVNISFIILYLLPGTLFLALSIFRDLALLNADTLSSFSTTGCEARESQEDEGGALEGEAEARGVVRGWRRFHAVKQYCGGAFSSPPSPLSALCSRRALTPTQRAAS
jgi:hypothetical protein